VGSLSPTSTRLVVLPLPLIDLVNLIVTQAARIGGVIAIDGEVFALWVKAIQSVRTYPKCPSMILEDSVNPIVREAVGICIIVAEVRKGMRSWNKVISLGTDSLVK
jgi:hypothetical protein